MTFWLPARKESFPIAPPAHFSDGSFSNHPKSRRYLSSKTPLLVVLDTEPFELCLSRLRPRLSLLRSRLCCVRPRLSRLRPRSQPLALAP